MELNIRDHKDVFNVYDDVIEIIKDLNQTVEVQPLDKLLLETNTPYLAPYPLRETINKPEYICYIVKK